MPERKVFARASTSEGHLPPGNSFDPRANAEYLARVDEAFRPASMPPIDSCPICGDVCGLREFQEDTGD